MRCFENAVEAPAPAAVKAQFFDAAVPKKPDRGDQFKAPLLSDVACDHSLATMGSDSSSLTWKSFHRDKIIPPTILTRVWSSR